MMVPDDAADSRVEYSTPTAFDRQSPRVFPPIAAVLVGLSATGWVTRLHGNVRIEP